MRRRHLLSLILIGCSSALIACSNSEAPVSSLSLAAMYHLKAIDGVTVPIRDVAGEVLDSGHVIRLRGDTVRVDTYSHVPGSGGNPGIGVIALGTWLASQSGNVVALFPLIASSLDTAFLTGDTLTLHAHPNRILHVEVYVAP